MPNSNAGYALNGDWRKLRSFLASGKEFVDLVNETVEEEANKIREAVENEIPFNAVPNAPSTIKRKGNNSTLVENGGLKGGGIVVNDYGGSTGKAYKRYFVIEGDPNKTVDTNTRTGSNMSYAQLLTLMENGGTGGKDGGAVIPPRPVLTITFDRMKSQIENDIIAKAKSAIHDTLR